MSFAPEFLKSILTFLLVLAPLVLIHELGHFFMARLFQIKILELGIGLPPRLYAFRKGETLYSINLLPIGGFVKLLGEEDSTHPRSFSQQAAWKRLIILAAGPATNALLAVGIFATLFMIPRDIPISQVLIATVLPNSPAATAGLERGDRIASINGKRIVSPAQAVYTIQLHPNKDLTWQIERAGETLGVKVRPRLSPPEGEGATGIQLVAARVKILHGSPEADAVGLITGDWIVAVGKTSLSHDKEVLQATNPKHIDTDSTEVLVWRAGQLVTVPVPGRPEGVYTILSTTDLDTQPDQVSSENFWASLPLGATQAWETLILARNEIARSFSGSSSLQLTGPIGIAKISGEVATSGLIPLLAFSAFLSINLAVINLLPIPGLDGGRVVFVLLEWLRRGQRVSAEREGFVHFVGFMLLLFIILVLSYFDIVRILEGTKLFP